MIEAVEQSYLALGLPAERIAGRDGLGDHLRVRLQGGGDGPGVLVLSHVDTVHPKGTLARQPWQVEGDSAFGPGVYDMKGGVYLAFHAIRELVRAGSTTPLPVVHLITADEEIGSPTSRALIVAEGARARYVLVTEPAREGGRIVTARKGVARFALRTVGRAAHAGARHQDGRSAVREMARLILALEELTDYARGITANVGLVAGGSGVNVVPAECCAEVDFRLPSLAAVDELLAWMGALTAFDPDVRLEVEGGLDRPPFEKSASIAALLEHARKLAAEIGFALEDTASGGGSDGNFLAASLPVLDGLGVDGMGAHTDHEQLYISSLVPRATLLRRLLETLS
jgi:glutamate carboxypeptidase